MTQEAKATIPIVAIEQAAQHVGHAVTIRGWLYNLRESGKLLFPIFRDGTGVIQGVVSQKENPEAFAALKGLTQESSVIVSGAIHDAGREPCDCRAGAHAKVTVEDSRAGVGNCTAGQDGKAGGGPEAHRGHRSAGGASPPPRRYGDVTSSPPRRYGDDSWAPLLGDVQALQAIALLRFAPDSKDPGVVRQRARGKLTCRERIDMLLDAGTFREVGSLAGFADYDEEGRVAGFTPANHVGGWGKIDHRTVVVCADDFTSRGGHADGAIGGKAAHLDRLSLDLHCPSIRLLDGSSGGVDRICLAVEREIRPTQRPERTKVVWIVTQPPFQRLSRFFGIRLCTGNVAGQDTNPGPGGEPLPSIISRRNCAGFA